MKRGLAVGLLAGALAGYWLPRAWEWLEDQQTAVFVADLRDRCGDG